MRGVWGGEEEKRRRGIYIAGRGKEETQIYFKKINEKREGQ